MLRQFTLTLALTVAVLAQDAEKTECTTERLPYALPEGASYRGDMSDAKNRRTYDLQDDAEVKSSVSCYEGVSPEGDWPTLNCQFQLERKPCMTKLNEVDGGIYFGLNDDQFDDWSAIRAKGLTSSSPVFKLTDGSDGEDRVDEDDPAATNAGSDKSGWILVNAEDKFEKDADGYMRGYITVDMRRAFTTSQPDYDPVIPVDETNCDVGYYYGSWYFFDDKNEDDVLYEAEDVFMPSAACAKYCNANECAVAKDSGMTLAMALGATTSALALLAF